MVAVYIIILCLSTFFAAWAPVRIAGRVARLMGRDMVFIPAGLFALISILAFMIVVGVPAMVLVGALLLLAAATAYGAGRIPPIAYWGTVGIATVLGVASLSLPAIEQVPPAALLLAAAILWVAITASGAFLADPMRRASLSLLAPCLPLLAAPFLGAPSSIALDSALILCGLFGALLAGGPLDRLAHARIPLGFLLGWLMIQAAIHGAWPCALISALAWSGAIAYATLHRNEAARDAFFTTP